VTTQRSEIRIIGIDCATHPRRVGLALGAIEGARARVDEARPGRRDATPLTTILGWLDAGCPALLALDAPLGWPATLGDELRSHHAGAPLRASPDAMFHRLTDDEVRKRLGKKPLEVGANYIARTAHAALTLLEHIRAATGLLIPLGWQNEPIRDCVAIEVYPAATLRAHALPHVRYKEPGQVEARRRLFAALAERIALPVDRSAMEASADALDAALCVLAGADFAAGVCLEPHDRPRAEREGWIWVRVH
jgi:hypothetical protein